MTPHILVVGHVGAGKSAFLNALHNQMNSGTEETFTADPVFKSAGTAKSVTQEVHSKVFPVDHNGEQILLRLTDVPGFDDADRSDEYTIQQISTFLRQPQ